MYALVDACLVGDVTGVESRIHVLNSTNINQEVLAGMTLLGISIAYGHIHITRRLLRVEGIIIPLGATCIPVCANDLEGLKVLVEAGADIALSDPRYDPLIDAARCGRLEIARYLLERGANPNGAPMSRWTP